MYTQLQTSLQLRPISERIHIFRLILVYMMPQRPRTDRKFDENNEKHHLQQRGHDSW